MTARAPRPTVDPDRVADALIYLADCFRQDYPEVIAARESEAHQRACPRCLNGDSCPEGEQRDTRARELSEAAR